MNSSEQMKETVIIGGAGSGIGRACLELFAQRNHRVIGLDKNASALSTLGNISFTRCPELRSVDLLDDTLTSWDALDLTIGNHEVLSLIQCVGGSVPECDHEAGNQFDWQLFEQAFAFNLKPAITLLNLCLPHMRSCRKGFVVNISSVAARRPIDKVHISYAAAKSAVVGFSRQLADDLAKDHILVNTVCPGIIESPRISERWSGRDASMNNHLLSQIPLGILGSPESVARLIYFLATSENSYITGAIVDINGGMFVP